MKNPTKENILKAHSEGCDDTKKAIENLWPDYFNKSNVKFNSSKIYAIYHDAGISVIHDSVHESERYSAYTLEANGNGYGTNDGENWDDITNDWGNEIKVFDNQKDFFTWALNKVS